MTSPSALRRERASLIAAVIFVVLVLAAISGLVSHDALVAVAGDGQ